MKILLLLLLFLPMAHAETVLRKAPIPNQLLRQGDARMVETEDGARFIRISLHTRHLDRIEAKIIEGETRNWPDSPASAAYIAALRRICREARESQKGAISLSIEWTLRTVTFTQGDSSTVLEDLSPDYLRDNLILIAADRFGLTRDAARVLFAP